MHETPHLLHETPTGAMRLLFASAYEAPPDERQPLHHHRCWELVYYRTGRVTCLIDGTLYHCEPGMLAIVPPLARHGEDASPTGWSCYCLGIEAPTHLRWPRMCTDDSDSMYAHLCKSLLREWNEHSAYRNDMVGFLLGQIDVLLRRARHPQLTHGEHIVWEAERLFHERLSASLAIGSVARELGISPSLLRHYFAQVRGQSPRDCLHAMRVERALALIRTSDLTLQAIASMCGYDSASHLSRQVKRATGKSPGNFRALE